MGPMCSDWVLVLVCHDYGPFGLTCLAGSLMAGFIPGLHGWSVFVCLSQSPLACLMDSIYAGKTPHVFLAVARWPLASWANPADPPGRAKAGRDAAGAYGRGSWVLAPLPPMALTARVPLTLGGNGSVQWRRLGQSLKNCRRALANGYLESVLISGGYSMVPRPRWVHDPGRLIPTLSCP